MDGLLRAGPELERLLPEIAARGHRLTLFRMGVEHFSPAENVRFNKGLSTERIDRALALAARLRKDLIPDLLTYRNRAVSGLSGSEKRTY
ncbi:MAG: hypothetical protein HY748_15850 [Elusimicrobia bacterium]|nr:hypothetical protein [Elusimicrobiota bacterium]